MDHCAENALAQWARWKVLSHADPLCACESRRVSQAMATLEKGEAIPRAPRLAHNAHGAAERHRPLGPAEADSAIKSGRTELVVYLVADIGIQTESLRQLMQVLCFLVGIEIDTH